MIQALISLVLSVSQAFTILDHQAIHDRTVHDLAQCGFLPADWQARDSETIRVANADEDIDFVRKMDYSHYYNPYHTIKMDRFDSSATVLETQSEFAKPLNREQILQFAGRVIHHLQDAAVPLHVIPVAHDPTDRFENFKTPNWEAFDPKPVDCTSIRSRVPTDLMDLLNESALATYAAARTNLDMNISGSKTRVTWLGSFWIDGADQEFGRYGFLGNSFGLVKTMIGTESVEVESKTFEDFKSQRMLQAKLYSQIALLWFLDRLK